MAIIQFRGAFFYFDETSHNSSLHQTLPRKKVRLDWLTKGEQPHPSSFRRSSLLRRSNEMPLNVLLFAGLFVT